MGKAWSKVLTLEFSCGPIFSISFTHSLSFSLSLSLSLSRSLSLSLSHTHWTFYAISLRSVIDVVMNNECSTLLFQLAIVCELTLGILAGFFSLAHSIFQLCFCAEIKTIVYCFLVHICKLSTAMHRTDHYFLHLFFLFATIRHKVKEVSRANTNWIIETTLIFITCCHVCGNQNPHEARKKVYEIIVERTHPFC